MRKVDGVTSVHVSLERGRTVIELRPANTVTLRQLRQIIKNNGFVSKEAQVTAGGEPTTIDGNQAFAVSLTNERLAAAAPPERDGSQWTFTVPAPR